LPSRALLTPGGVLAGEYAQRPMPRRSAPPKAVSPLRFAALCHRTPKGWRFFHVAALPAQRRPDANKAAAYQTSRSNSTRSSCGVNPWVESTRLRNIAPRWTKPSPVGGIPIDKYYSDKTDWKTVTMKDLLSRPRHLAALGRIYCLSFEAVFRLNSRCQIGLLLFCWESSKELRSSCRFLQPAIC